MTSILGLLRAPKLRHCFILLAIYSLVSTVASFGSKRLPPSTRKRITTIATARSNINLSVAFSPIRCKFHRNSTLKWRSHANFGRSGYCFNANNQHLIRRRDGMKNPLKLHSPDSNPTEESKNSKKQRINGRIKDIVGWLPNNRMFGWASLFHAVLKRILSRTPIKLWQNRGGSNNNGRGNTSSNNKEDPLNQVRLFRQLPLRKACLAISIYLAVGVVAFKGFFPEPSWSILDALYFSSVCLSTIGYGDLVPSTDSGKIFAAIFGMSGILLWSSAIVSVGAILVQSEAKSAERKLRAKRKNAIVKFYEENMPDVLKLREREDMEQKEGVDTNREFRGRGEGSASAISSENSSWPLMVPLPPNHLKKEQPEQQLHTFLLVRSLIKPLLVILSGGTFVGRLEGWNLCDSVYYSLITASTIGFGDFSPATRAGRIAAIALIPVLLAAAGDIFARVGVFAIRNRTRKLFASQAEIAEWLTKEQADQMDLNHDGKVSKSEYVLYMLIEAGIVDKDEFEVLEDQFERFDVTRSGYIESEDLKAMKKFRKKLKRERTKRNSRKSA